MEQGLEFDVQLTKTPENVSCENLSNADEISLKNWVFAWAADVKGTPLDSDINDLIWVIEKHIKEQAALQSPRVPDAMFKKLGSLIKAVDGGTFENDPHDAIINAAIRTLSSPRVPVIEILDTVLEQAEDDGLWFNAKHASEAYLQQELRRLHAVIERAYAELQKGN
jgi:hypothetical protein